MSISELKKAVFLCLICGLSFVSHSLTANAEKPVVVAGVVVVEGEVFVKRSFSDTRERVTPSTGFFEGDVIECRNGKVRIAFGDGTVVSLAPWTTYSVDTYSEKKSLFSLIKGKVLTIFSKIAGFARELKVQTPTAVVGVRGTRFVVTFDGGTTEVWVQEGEVIVTSSLEELAERRVTVSAGMRTRVHEGKPPEPPESVPSEKMKEVLKDFARVDPADLLKDAVEEAGIEQAFDSSVGEFMRLPAFTPEARESETALPPVDQQPVPEEEALERVKIKLLFPEGQK